MKTIIITGLIYCLTLGFQQEPLSKVANITPPQKALKLNSEQGINYEKSNFKSLGLVKGAKQIYRVDNVLITFGDFEKDKDDHNSLNDIKDHILGEVGEIAAAKSEDQVNIVTIKNTQYLVHKFHLSDEYFFNFLSETKKQKGIKGTVQFKKADMNKGEAIFNELLGSIEFKN